MDPVKRYKSISRVASLLALLVPAVGFFTWNLNLAGLQSAFPILPSMVPPIAFMLAMSGISLLMLLDNEAKGRNLTGQALAFIVTATSAFTLYRYLFHSDHVDYSIYSFVIYSSLPAQPSTHTILMFFLVGLALLLLNTNKPSYTFFAQFFIVVISLISCVMLFDSLTREAIAEILMQKGIALSTGLTFFMLCLGILLARPDQGLMGIFSSNTTGGLMLRRVFPFTVGVPIIFSWLRIQGEKAAIFDTAFGVTVMTAVVVFVINLIICWNAKMLHQLDHDRQKSQNELKRSYEHLEEEVQKRTFELLQANDMLKKEITEKHLLEKEVQDFLKERNLTKGDLMKYASIVSSSDDAIIGATLDGKITSWNRGAEEIYGYFAGEMLGQRMEALFPGEQRISVDELRMKIRQGISVKHYETVHQRKDGQRIYVSLTISPIRAAEEKVIAVSVISRDVTERKRVEKIMEHQRQELQKTNQELDSFVYTASHDLRAPLRAISSFAEFLEEDYQKKLDDQGKAYILKIRNGAMRMSKLIDDLLTLSQVSRMENPFEDVVVHDLLEGVLDRLEFETQRTGTMVRMDAAMPVMHCDRIKISEVFVNLIHNAIKFSSKNTQRKPVVEVGYRDVDGYHEFHVKDNGIGIDPEYHQQIFGFLRRLHTAQEYDGSGVGLSIVKRIVDEHGGEIWVTSKLGEGATFCFTIPKNLKNRKKLGEILVSEGLIDKRKLNEVLEKQMSGETDAPAENNPLFLNKESGHGKGSGKENTDH